jgi:hypothetical protein
MQKTSSFKHSGYFACFLLQFIGILAREIKIHSNRYFGADILFQICQSHPFLCDFSETILNVA